MPSVSVATNSPKINFTRREVIDLKPRWDLIRDCISGEIAVKKQATKYLPAPNPGDTSAENQARYEAYKTRALFYGATGRTLAGFLGQVFARDPVATLPPQMEPMRTDVDGASLTLVQQSRKALALTLAHGRAGLLVDYPRTDGPVSKAEIDSGKVKPNILIYEPWDIINWRLVTRGNKRLLSLVVLSEQEVVDDDGFEQEWDPYYRVLRLDADGFYHSQVWFLDTEKNEFVLESDSMPTDGAGKPWTEIPFQFIGSENNDSMPDLPPLYDLAAINLAHYRNSADHEESCYIVGQPTPYFGGLTEEWVKSILGGKIPLGARAAVLLPEGGTAGLLQAEPNTMPFEAMKHKEAQMVALGAKLVEQNSVQRTAFEAGVEEASTTSVLATCAGNVSAAYSKALMWAAKFLNIDIKDTDENRAVDFELNKEFDLSRLPATEQAQLIANWQANAISFSEMRDGLRRGGVAFLDDDAAKEEIDSAGIDLGMPVGSPASAAAAAAEAKAKADAQAAKDKAKNPPPAN